MDEPHLWEALRYVELNPVRARMVAEPEEWRWSSAAAHLGTARPDICLEMEAWQQRWTPGSWHEYLAAGPTEAEVEAIGQSTHTGRPLGTSEFVKTLEQVLKRQLVPQRGGRAPKPAEDGRQTMLGFEKIGKRPVCPRFSGRLNRARTKQRKSETHGRKHKGQK
jgi:putative transposase